HVEDSYFVNPNLDSRRSARVMGDLSRSYVPSIKSDDVDKICNRRRTYLSPRAMADDMYNTESGISTRIVSPPSCIKSVPRPPLSAPLHSRRGRRYLGGRENGERAVQEAFMGPPGRFQETAMDGYTRRSGRRIVPPLRIPDREVLSERGSGVKKNIGFLSERKKTYSRLRFADDRVRHDELGAISDPVESSPMSDADAEVKYWEKKLGLDGDNADKVKEEFIKDGWDEDFFKSLDDIDDAVKERKKELKAEHEGEGSEEEDGDASDGVSDLQEEEGEEDSADEEVKYWEHKLGIDKNRQKVMDELEKDGLDPDLFAALDGIEDAVNNRKTELNGDADAPTKAKTAHEASEPAEKKPSTATGAYVPPHLRQTKKRNTEDEERAMKLSKIRGLVNKLSEGNIELITAEVVALLGGGDQSVTEGYAREFVESAIGNPHISLTLLGTYCAHLVAVTMICGGGPLAMTLELIGKFVRGTLPMVSDDSSGNSKAKISNCCKVIALLFTFGIISPNVVIDLIRGIFEPNDMHRLDLVLVVLRFAGRKLRKDNLQDFSAVLELLTKDSKEVEKEASGKYQFLLRELEDLKNNKVNFTALSHFEANFGWLKASNLLRGRGTPEDSLVQVPMNIFDEDQVAQVEGSQWWRGLGSSRIVKVDSMRKSADEDNERLLELAAKMKMNTDLRRSIFIALMGAEDYKHAVFRIGQVIGSRPKLVPQVAVVLLHCAIHESAFNRYYCRVAKALTELPGTWGSRYSHALKNALTKLLQQCHTYPVRRVGILAKVSAFMVSEGIADMTILRFLDFTKAETDEGRAKIDVLIREMILELIELQGDDAPKMFYCVGKYNDLRQGLGTMVRSMVIPKLSGDKQSHGKAIIAALEECKEDADDDEDDLDF
ncbi:Nucleolar MIF4G domain-containing protein 1, partial [Perkinsus chesapeaki]